MPDKIKGEVTKGVALKVTLSGPIATELRRISHNLDVEPGVLVKEAVTEYLKRKYGVTV